MLWLLRAFFTIILVSMLWLATWASTECGLFSIPDEVLGHPWFITTLVDAYWAFLAFFVWVAWKEQNHAARALWLVATILLGNMAIAAYFLRELFAIRTDNEIGLVFSRRNPGRIHLATTLAALGVLTYVFAWIAR